MPRRPAVFGTVAAALLVPLATISSAQADVINGCDVHDDNTSPACLAFNTDGYPWLDPEVEFTWPSGPFHYGQTVTVTATGADLLRPVTVPITRYTDDGDNEVQVASLTVGPGSLAASTTFVLDGVGDLDYSVWVDDYDAVGLYVSDDFSAFVPAVASSLTSDLPPGRVVKVGAKATPATGTVTGGPRPVHLQVRAKDGAWVTVAETTSAANGGYTLAVPTFWVGNHTYRAHAPAHGSSAAVDGTRTSSLKVTRTYKPTGTKAHNFLFGRGPRWNACTPIRYGFNTSRMPKWARSEVRYALREVSAATGLRFADTGSTTTHVPWARKETDFPETLDLVFAFSTPKQVPGLTGSTIGLGGAAYSGSVAFEGGVTLDVAQKASRKVWREVVLHEIGHVIGLGHVGDKRQVMASGAIGKTRYQKGDLVGLAALGAGAGACTGDPDLWGRASTRTAPDHRRSTTAEVRRVVLP
ncbi:hypothetical protein CFI00_16895 [Nocardioides sp. S5]|uniref:matrixin family metalloprotease n=1 Tax=Nocardioides sp. S5 TaxID=2017486 RepID=UPI001A8DEC84|nr:matrixin family metalloprotease [Nocardioides sp. S5]QSR32154.1 hypothetical protein CFI00_16895 [Nocardioides sp. S5]